MSTRTAGAVGLFALAIYGITYWSLQPTCGPGEVRVRGMFMTECVARAWQIAK